MDGAMGQEEDVVEAVVTCEGDFHDPELNSRIEKFRHRLKDLLLTEKRSLLVKKVEPWNSVKVTFTIPRGAALRLRQLAQSGNDTLRQMGVLSVQIQGDTRISLTIAGRNNESTQLLVCTSLPPGNSSLPFVPVGAESGIHNSGEFGSSQGSSSDEMSRNNIVNYLRQGSVLRQNSALFDSILGPGSSSASALGFSVDIHQPLDSVPGPSASNTLFRPNNIATMALPNQAVGGSHLNSSFPFTKTTGAFHPPVPRLPFSAGQSTAANTTHHVQAGSNSVGRLMGPLTYETKIARPSLSCSGPSAQVFQHNMNTFSPVSASRFSSSRNMSSLPLCVPPSSSPTSSFMRDLPPPPPYPSTSNTPQHGKLVNSSSPLLINLLQTDPLTAAVGLASGNPNKPMTAGELNSNSPPKKKRWPKKTKDRLAKPYDNSVSSKTGVQTHFFTSDLDRSNTRLPEDTITRVDLMHSRSGVLLATCTPDSFTCPLPDIKPLFSSDRLVGEGRIDSPSSDELQSDFSRSAIGAGCTSTSKLSDSNGQDTFSKDLDPFSMEIAAGKIINPYTGQLEPRDSVLDGVQSRVSDQNIHSQGTSFATQMLTKKAKELKKANENSVPKSSSQMLDVNVMKTTIPIHLGVSTSTTAAFVHSGASSQASSDRLTSFVATHRRNLIGDVSARETKESSLSSSNYAVTTKQWKAGDIDTDKGVKISSSHTLTSLSPRTVSSLSNTLQKNFVSASAPINGPLAGGQTVRHSINPPHQHVVVPSCSAGVQSSHQGSVINSSVTVSSSLPLASSNHSNVVQTQIQRSVAAIHTTSPSDVQNSLYKCSPVSSSVSFTSVLDSTYSSIPSSQIQMSARLKTDSSHISSIQQQAASSNIAEGSVATKPDSSNLLNSLPEKHTDSRSNTGSPPDNKTSSEGDENSNHSGLITDTLPEHSGTAALLEHSGVKAENHDSGVGSSSERSDDTPSEPGDGEFRPGQSGADNEESSKAPLQKTVNCKLESKVISSSNTITVGYMVNPADGTAQSKLSHVKDSRHVSKSNVLSSTPPAPVADISQFFHAHIMSMDKQTGLLTGGSQASVGIAVEEGKAQSLANCPAKIRENGQSPDDLSNNSDVRMNGPTSQSNIEKMIKVMSEVQHKTKSSPKQNSKKGLLDVPPDHLKLQTEIIDKMSKLHQFAECAKETSDASTKANTLEKAHSPDALSQRLSASDDRPDQIILDMEELVNGKILGHGGGVGIESKGGSNITSIYSKRSSPVNVNMLNHIYAPGLPLPRRLTESVQRLVKPLPASESSVSYSQMRPCKSPGLGGSPRAGSGSSIQSSMRMSGVRSPGASIPKHIPNDRHSLLSGGLDLAGITSLQHVSSITSDQTDLSTALSSCKRGSPALTADVLLQDPVCFSPGQKSPPNLLLDSRSYSGKMLSQSFPPHKSRDMKPNITHRNHGLFLSLQSNSSCNEKNLSSSVNTTYHSQMPRSKVESSQAFSQDSRLHPSNRSQQDTTLSNHLPSVQDTGQSRLAPQQPVVTDNNHSTNSSHVIENSSAYPSHSNASSPVMPVLQRGHEYPVAPTMAYNMPNISSQPSPSISSAKEISTTSNTGSSVPLSDATQNKHVPYSNNTVDSSGTALNTVTKSAPASTLIPPSPLLSSVPPTSGRTEDTASHLTRPRTTLSSLNISLPQKLKKTNVPTNSSPSSSRSGSSTLQFSRNLFESVSESLRHENISPNKSDHRIENNSYEPAANKNSPSSAHGNNSQCDSISSVLVSCESKGDIVVKSVFHTSNDGGDARASTVVTGQTSKIDLKSGPALKSVHTSRDSSPTTFLSTEVVNLDFSLPPQACNALSLNIGSNKGISFSGDIIKTSFYVSDSLQENESSQTSQPPTSSISSVSLFSSDLLLTSSSMSDTTASIFAGKEETTSKLPMGVSISSTPSVKEPILEILASTLESTITKTNKISPVKSFVEKQIPSCGLEFQRAEDEEVSTGSRMVTIQSGPHRHQDYSHRQTKVEFTSSDGAVTQNSVRPVRKRKPTHEDEVESSSAESAAAKKPHTVSSLESETKPSAKSPMTDNGGVFKLDTNQESGCIQSKEVSIGKYHGQNKPSGIVTVEPVEKETEMTNKTALRVAHEEKDSQRNMGKTRRTSASESKEQGSTRESRPHCHAGSSDESHSNRSSSNESKESAHKEGRPSRVAVGADKERRVNRTSTSSSTLEDKDLTKDGRSSRPLAADHRDSKLNKGTSDTNDDKDDHKESHLQRSSSADDKEKAKSAKDTILDKSGHFDKVNTDSKLEDGQKKSHRIKRQFYAYVPEKSIDQTYFDTPILSGRTRSKNKPSDQDAAPAQDDVASTPNAVESQAHTTGAQRAAPAKADGSAETAGGKRPVRSVRTKDNSQEQNASKRRRIQQHR